VLALTTSPSADPTVISLFLHKLTQIFKDYFKDLEEESIKDNFVVIYELLDEVLDFGYPQFTETSLLREYYGCLLSC
jgi:AP-1 complex subunit mu